MRVALEVIGVIAIINGFGGLLFDIGMLSNVADGGSLTVLQVVVGVIGVALVAGSLLSRKASRTSAD